MAFQEISQRTSLELRGITVTPPIISEYGWYVADGGHLSGVLFLDLTDKDYGFVILGRDDDGHHRWVDGEHSFPSKEETLERMGVMLSKYEESGQTLFSQKNPDRLQDSN